MIKGISKATLVFAFFLSFFMSQFVSAQASTYTFAQSFGTYSPITGGSVATSSTNGSPSLDLYVSTNITIPSFSFAGTAYTKMFVTGNGAIALGSSSPSSSTYTVLSSTTGGNVFLAPLSADLNQQSTGVSEIRYETIGNEFIVQWKNFRRYNLVESINFQVRINTATGVIKFVYDGVPPYATSTSYQPQIGIKSATGNYNALTVGAAGSWNTPTNITTGIANSSVATFNGSVGPSSGLTYTWTPLVMAPCATPSASPTALVFGTTTTSAIAGSFTAASPAPSKYLVVRSTSATAPTPVDGTVYTVGAATLGAGTNVRSASNATTFSDTGLTAGAQYYYYIFSYNDLCTGEPFYMATPLSGTQNTVCAAATGLGSNTITTTSANITWTGSGNYVLEYGASGFTPGTGATAGAGGIIASSNATSPYALSGLSSSTTYVVYIRQVCAMGGFSANSTSTTFTTLCDPVIAPTVLENFTVAVPPNCWNRSNGLLSVSTTLTTSTAWTSDDFANITSPVNKSAKINLYGTTRKDWLITPSYNLGTSGNLQLEFDLALTTFGNTTANTLGADDKFAVVISTDNGVTWSDTNILQQWSSTTSIPNGSGTHITISLASYTGTVKIGFYGESTVSNADNDLFIDNVVVTTPPVSPPNCATGQIPATAATGIIRNSTLSWTAATGSPLGYDVYFGTSAIPPLVGNQTGLSYTPPTMLATTTYYWKIEPRNANGAASCSVQSFETGSSIVYCASVPTSNDNEGISSVTLGATTFPVTDVMYYNYSTPIDFAAGVMNTTAITFKTGYEYDTNIWIDLNDNGTFDSSELLFQGTSLSDNPTTLDASFLLNAAAPLGIHKMRIGTADSGQATPNPCYSGSYGVTIDAMINITAPPFCLAPTTLASIAITATTATLSWTASSSSPSNGYDIYYSTTNTAPNDLTTPNVDNHPTVSYNAPGLSSSSTYYWWVRSDCGSETSTWASGGSFTTECATITTLPFLESFEGISSGVPTCWAVAGTTTTSNYNFSSFATGQAGKGLRFDSYINTLGKTGELITPTFDLTSLMTAELKFYFKNPTGGNFEVLISSDGGATYTSLENALIGQTAWLQKTYDISSYISNNVKIKFIGTSNYGPTGAYIDLDEIYIGTASNITWDGLVWSNANVGPTSADDAIINGNYNIAAAFEAKNLTVNSGKTLIVNSFVKAANVINNGDIIVANNANFVQTGSFTPGTGSTFKVSRASKQVQRLDFISWSSPLENSAQTLKGFSYGNVGGSNQSTTGTLDNRFYNYNGGTFVEILNPASTTFVTAGKGFHIRTPDDFTTVAPGDFFQGLFEGVKPNTGTINYDASAISGQYVFLGNPYPSTISMASFLTSNTQTTGTFYIWNSAAKMIGTEYTGTENYITHTSSGSNPPGSAFYVPVGQGFFIDRGTNTSITNYNNFVFNDAMRSTTETGTFAKSAVVDRFWLKMASSSGSPYFLFAFTADATTGLDHGYDGKMIENNPDTFYTKINGEKMAIDTHGSFQTDDSFDVYINSTAVKNYTISIAQKDGLFNNGQSIYLRDKTNGTITDLTNGNYTFTSAGTGEDNRFEVFFINSVLATSNGVKEELSIYGNEGILYVESPSEIANVKVYDLSGRLILNKKGQGKTMQNAVNDVKFVLVSVQLKDGSTVSKKVKL